MPRKVKHEHQNRKKGKKKTKTSGTSFTFIDGIALIIILLVLWFMAYIHYNSVESSYTTPHPSWIQAENLNEENNTRVIKAASKDELNDGLFQELSFVYLLLSVDIWERWLLIDLKFSWRSDTPGNIFMMLPESEDIPALLLPHISLNMAFDPSGVPNIACRVTANKKEYSAYLPADSESNYLQVILRENTISISLRGAEVIVAHLPPWPAGKLGSIKMIFGSIGDKNLDIFIAESAVIKMRRSAELKVFHRKAQKSMSDFIPQAPAEYAYFDIGVMQMVFKFRKSWLELALNFTLITEVSVKAIILILQPYKPGMTPTEMPPSIELYARRIGKQFFITVFRGEVKKEIFIGRSNLLKVHFDEGNLVVSMDDTKMKTLETKDLVKDPDGELLIIVGGRMLKFRKTPDTGKSVICVNELRAKAKRDTLLHRDDWATGVCGRESRHNLITGNGDRKMPENLQKIPVENRYDLREIL